MIDTIFQKAKISKIIAFSDPPFLEHGSISVKFNKVCNHRSFRQWMIYKFCHTHKLRTINDEFITDAFLAKHNKVWEKHKPLDLNNLDSKMEHHFWEGNLVDDIHDVRDNMEKIIY
jgi:hypothetical protein